MSDKPADEAERLRRFRQDKCYRLTARTRP
jgi:hypothetical protein